MNGLVHGLAHDCKRAGRSLRAAPAITLAAALTLALGIGATTAVFSVANGLVLRPLPVTDPQQLATITSATALRHGFQAGAGWNYSMWEQLRQRAGAFDGAFAWTLQRLDLSDGGEAQPASVLFASGEFFSMLGVGAAIGRMFTAADDQRGGGRDGAVAVVSHEFWRRHFNSALHVVGSRLSIEGTPVTIIGVAPAGFHGVDVGQPFDLAMPFGADALVRGTRSIAEGRRSYTLTVMLRLNPGQTTSEATAALRTMQPDIIPRDAPRFLEEPFVLVPASTGVSDRSRLRQQYFYPLVLLSIVSALVVLIVCTNIASLFIARAAARRHELSVRLAVGAPRWRLARETFVEAAVLGIGGSVAGTMFAVWASRVLVAQLPSAGGPAVIDLPIDWRVLSFSIALAASAVALFGTAPALYAMRVPPLEALQMEGRWAAGRAARLSGGLVVAQVALSIVILAAAGLFVRTLGRLSHVPLGFDPGGLLVVSVNTARARLEPAAALQMQQHLLDTVAAIPGVRSAAGSTWTPVGSGGGGLLLDARGRRSGELRSVAFNFVTPGWFDTYGTPIRMGRDFADSDGPAAPRVALVNETLHRTLRDRPDGYATTIEAGPCGRGGCTVVGVVADAIYGGSLRDAPPPTVYVPFAQSAGLTAQTSQFRMTLRAAGDAAAVARQLTAVVRGVHPALSFTVSRLDQDVAASVAQERLVATLAGFAALVALLLSAVGLYGVTSYAMTQRRGEIGIRLALGGRPHAVLRTVLRRTAFAVATGIVTGLVSALWLGRFVAPLLYGLEPRDPATLAGSALTLAAVAALAGGIPAWRAARIDPARVLREN